MKETLKHEVILDRQRTALLVIDVQEKIYKAVRKHEKMLDKIIKLVNGANTLEVPIFFTEQYPQGLGETIQPIKEKIEGKALEKFTFSCSGAGDLFLHLSQNGINQVIVAGIEAHVCVQQTVLDLIANGFQVNVPLDAISSRYKIDFKTSVQRMSDHGAEIMTVEAILFELMGNCKIAEFKTVSSIIK